MHSHSRPVEKIQKLFAFEKKRFAFTGSLGHDAKSGAGGKKNIGKGTIFRSGQVTSPNIRVFLRFHNFAFHFYFIAIPFSFYFNAFSTKKLKTSLNENRTFFCLKKKIFHKMKYLI